MEKEYPDRSYSPRGMQPLPETMPRALMEQGRNTLTSLFQPFQSSARPVPLTGQREQRLADQETREICHDDQPQGQ